MSDQHSEHRRLKRIPPLRMAPAEFRSRVEESSRPSSHADGHARLGGRDRDLGRRGGDPLRRASSAAGDLAVATKERRHRGAVTTPSPRSFTFNTATTTSSTPRPTASPTADSEGGERREQPGPQGQLRAQKRSPQQAAEAVEATHSRGLPPPRALRQPPRGKFYSTGWRERQRTPNAYLDLYAHSTTLPEPYGNSSLDNICCDGRREQRHADEEHHELYGNLLLGRAQTNRTARRPLQRPTRQAMRATQAGDYRHHELFGNLLNDKFGSTGR